MSLEGASPDLRGVFESERACCARLLAILAAERAAAAAYDHAALLACLKEREGIQAEWRRAGDSRRRALAASAVPLATLIADDPALAEVVEAVRREATAVQRAQRVNEGLIRRLLAEVSDLLTVIAREHPGSRYDGRAALTTPSWRASAGRWSA